MSNPKLKSIPSLTFSDKTSWKTWLSTEASTSPGIWLTLARKKQTQPTTSLTGDEALEEALCHGWINGQARTNDDGTPAQRFTPRTRTSMWSKRNIAIVERLEAEGRMYDAGRQAIAAAKADGRWDRAYGGSAISDAPKDLVDAIEREGEGSVKEKWEQLSKGSRYAMFVTLSGLRTEKGRQRRIQGYVEMLRRGESPHGPQQQQQQTRVKKGRVEKAKAVKGRIAETREIEESRRGETTTKSGRSVRKPGMS